MDSSAEVTFLKNTSLPRGIFHTALRTFDAKSHCKVPLGPLWTPYGMLFLAASLSGNGSHGHGPGGF